MFSLVARSLLGVLQAGGIEWFIRNRVDPGIVSLKGIHTEFQRGILQSDEAASEIATDLDAASYFRHELRESELVKLFIAHAGVGAGFASMVHTWNQFDGFIKGQEEAAAPVIRHIFDRLSEQSKEVVEQKTGIQRQDIPTVKLRLSRSRILAAALFGVVNKDLDSLHNAAIAVNEGRDAEAGLHLAEAMFHFRLLGNADLDFDGDAID